VNLVDALDRDNIITKFEYDKDLGNGWFLDDEPFATPEETPLPDTDTNYEENYPEDGDERGVVYGIEAQQLTISEVLSLMALQVTDQMTGTATDLAETEYNDKEDRYFTYIELRNASPFEVGFENDNWQIRMVPKDDTIGEERQLTLRDNAGVVGTGGLFTIATAGDAHNVDAGGTVASLLRLIESDAEVVAAGGLVCPPSWRSPT